VEGGVEEAGEFCRVRENDSYSGGRKDEGRL
jgi:hypothetical protein